MADDASTKLNKNEYSRILMLRRRADSQEIGDIPPIHDPIRRRDCIADFELYCKTYHAAEFSKPWADYHKYTAAKIQEAVECGGWYARALPRGGGKTTLCCCGVEWAALRGSHSYPVLFGATDDLAARLLKGIKMQFLTNDLLLEDFPHAMFPIRILGGEARRGQGQKYHGTSTFIEWKADRIVLPWINEEPSISNGVIIEAFGISGALRGLKHTLPDGTSLRPDLGLVDDPQTRESAKSPTQSRSRLDILTGDVAYLAGPGKQMPVLCTCTIMYEDDLAHQLLDRDKHPEWQGQKTKMVETFPDNMELWDKYADILRSSLKQDDGNNAANDFYRQNQLEMDAGAQVSWPARYRDDEISALQHAMNLKIRDEAAFYAECQNEPHVEDRDMVLCTPDELVKKCIGYPRGVVPPDCSAITAFTDVQGEHLFWMLVAWMPDFTGFVIDYGAWPDQKRNYFSRRDIRKKLSKAYSGDESGIMFAALTDLGEKLAGREYRTYDGRIMQLSRWCIDGNWRARTSAVLGYARQSKFANIITVTQGRGVKASENPFSEAKRAIKYKTGPGWFWQDGPGPARWVTFDANLWKKRVHEALLLEIGSRGSLQFFKEFRETHRMLADHLLAERPTKVEAHGRTVYEFDEIPGRDNEGLDCLVGCLVGASICGITRDSERQRTSVRYRRPKVSYME